MSTGYLEDEDDEQVSINKIKSDVKKKRLQGLKDSSFSMCFE